MKTAFSWNVGMSVQTDCICPWKQLGRLLLWFSHSVSFFCFALITFQNLTSFFDVILPVTLRIMNMSEHKCGPPPTFSTTYFLNECNCCTSSIVHFTVLPFFCVCQICGPFCQHYLMIVHYLYLSVCVGEAVLLKKKKLFLNVYILVLQFAQACLLISPDFEKGPETQQGC